MLIQGTEKSPIPVTSAWIYGDIFIFLEGKLPGDLKMDKAPKKLMRPHASLLTTELGRSWQPKNRLQSKLEGS